GISTTPGMVMGTISYMSPEQARGLEVDARSDIFSLGVALYEMLSGAKPFSGATTADLIAAILDKEPAPRSHCMREAPKELDRIVSRALRKNREDRYQAVQELLLDLKSLKRKLELESQLEQARYSTAEVARDAPAVGYLKSLVGRYKRGVIAALSALVVTAATLIFYFNYARFFHDSSSSSAGEL